MRVALTGGATGIGAEVAARLRARGDHVTVLDRADPAEGADVWIETDLSDLGSIPRALSQGEGPFDALVLNAGLPPREGMAEAILKVNWFGLRAVLDGLLPMMGEGGSVVATASRAGAAWRENVDEVKALMALDPAELPEFVARRSMGHVRAYALSKEAVIALVHARTETLLARGLRINCVSPAAVETGILPDFKAAFGDRVARNLARVGRAGLPGEVADAILFLASPESGWIKGQDIVIDGGLGALAVSDALGLAEG